MTSHKARESAVYGAETGLAKVLVLHTLPPLVTGAGRMPDEFDLCAAAQGIADAIPGAVVAGVRGHVQEVIALLERHRPDVIFNACEAPLGRPDLEPHVAALFEWLGVRFTGSGSGTLALCRRKDRTKAVLMANGVPVPCASGFPCIVKPADEDGSAGIGVDSICDGADALARRPWRGWPVRPWSRNFSLAGNLPFPYGVRTSPSRYRSAKRFSETGSD